MHRFTEDTMPSKGQSGRKASAPTEQKTRETLEAEHGEVWNTRQLAQAFVVTAVIGNEIVVRRKSDNVVGVLSFQNCPRYYYGFRRSPDTSGGKA